MDDASEPIWTSLRAVPGDSLEILRDKYARLSLIAKAYRQRLAQPNSHLPQPAAVLLAVPPVPLPLPLDSDGVARLDGQASDSISQQLPRINCRNEALEPGGPQFADLALTPSPGPNCGASMATASHPTAGASKQQQTKGFKSTTRQGDGTMRAIAGKGELIFRTVPGAASGGNAAAAASGSFQFRDAQPRPRVEHCLAGLVPAFADAVTAALLPQSEGDEWRGFLDPSAAAAAPPRTVSGGAAKEATALNAASPLPPPPPVLPEAQVQVVRLGLQQSCSDPQLQPAPTRQRSGCQQLPPPSGSLGGGGSDGADAASQPGEASGAGRDVAAAQMAEDVVAKADETQDVAKLNDENDDDVIYVGSTPGDPAAYGEWLQTQAIAQLHRCAAQGASWGAGPSQPPPSGRAIKQRSILQFVHSRPSQQSSGSGRGGTTSASKTPGGSSSGAAAGRRGRGSLSHSLRFPTVIQPWVGAAQQQQQQQPNSDHPPQLEAKQLSPMTARVPTQEQYPQADRGGAAPPSGPHSHTEACEAVHALMGQQAGVHGPAPEQRPAAAKSGPTEAASPRLAAATVSADQSPFRTVQLYPDRLAPQPAEADTVVSSGPGLAGAAGAQSAAMPRRGSASLFALQRAGSGGAAAAAAASATGTAAARLPSVGCGAPVGGSSTALGLPPQPPGAVGPAASEAERRAGVARGQLQSASLASGHDKDEEDEDGSALTCGNARPPARLLRRIRSASRDSANAGVRHVVPAMPPRHKETAVGATDTSAAATVEGPDEPIGDVPPVASLEVSPGAQMAADIVALEQPSRCRQTGSSAGVRLSPGGAAGAALGETALHGAADLLQTGALSGAAGSSSRQGGSESAAVGSLSLRALADAVVGFGILTATASPHVDRGPPPQQGHLLHHHQQQQGELSCGAAPFVVFETPQHTEPQRPPVASQQGGTAPLVPLQLQPANDRSAPQEPDTQPDVGKGPGRPQGTASDSEAGHPGIRCVPASLGESEEAAGTGSLVDVVPATPLSMQVSDAAPPASGPGSVAALRRGTAGWGRQAGGALAAAGRQDGPGHTLWASAHREQRQQQQHSWEGPGHGTLVVAATPLPLQSGTGPPQRVGTPVVGEPAETAALAARLAGAASACEHGKGYSASSLATGRAADPAAASGTAASGGGRDAPGPHLEPSADPSAACHSGCDGRSGSGGSGGGGSRDVLDHPGRILQVHVAMGAGDSEHKGVGVDGVAAAGSRPCYVACLVAEQHRPWVEAGDHMPAADDEPLGRAPLPDTSGSGDVAVATRHRMGQPPRRQGCQPGRAPWTLYTWLLPPGGKAVLHSTLPLEPAPTPRQAAAATATVSMPAVLMPTATADGGSGAGGATVLPHGRDQDLQGGPSSSKATEEEVDWRMGGALKLLVTSGDGLALLLSDVVDAPGATRGSQKWPFPDLPRGPGPPSPPRDYQNRDSAGIGGCGGAATGLGAGTVKVLRYDGGGWRLARVLSSASSGMGSAADMSARLRCLACSRCSVLPPSGQHCSQQPQHHEHQNQRPQGSSADGDAASVSAPEMRDGPLGAFNSQAGGLTAPAEGTRSGWRNASCLQIVSAGDRGRGNVWRLDLSMNTVFHEARLPPPRWEGESSGGVVELSVLPGRNHLVIGATADGCLALWDVGVARAASELLDGAAVVAAPAGGLGPAMTPQRLQLMATAPPTLLTVIRTPGCVLRCLQPVCVPVSMWARGQAHGCGKVHGVEMEGEPAQAEFAQQPGRGDGGEREVEAFEGPVSEVAAAAFLALAGAVPACAGETEETGAGRMLGNGHTGAAWVAPVLLRKGEVRVGEGIGVPQVTSLSARAGIGALGTRQGKVLVWDCARGGLVAGWQMPDSVSAVAVGSRMIFAASGSRLLMSDFA